MNDTIHRRMRKSSKNFREQGFVSIIVAATVMILLSLITIGFTRIMQREQREALDRQLTRQATYAAESGINAVWQFIRDSDLPESKQEKQLCSRDDNPYNLDTSALGSIELPGQGASTYTPSPYFDADDESAAIQITCILYDKNPSEIKDTVSENEETITPFEEKDDDEFETITIQWSGSGAAGYHPDCGDGSDFEFPDSFNGTPVLKLDLYNTASFSRNDLANRASYMYLIPCDSGVTSFGITGNREIYKQDIDCSDGGNCSVTVNVSGLNTSRFFIRHKLLYGPGSVTLSAIDENGDDAEFRNSQSVIDVTARATDVVRRLRVHLPYAKSENLPGGVVTIGGGNGAGDDGLCKDISIIDGIRITNNCSIGP